jgi:very-short-patch-repair endonuclease
MRDKGSPPAAILAELAARQHSVVSARQLVANGFSRAKIARWVRAGHLHHLHRGVFAVGHPAISREGRYLAAVLAAGDGAVLSHTPASRHLRLNLDRRVGTIHISLPRHARRRVQGVIVHRPRLLEPIDILIRARIPTTTHTRTLFDLAPFVGPDELRELFERAEYLEELDRGRLRVLLDRASGHKGATELRKLLDYEPLPLSRIRSKLEKIILTTCRTHALPVPAVNAPLLDYEPDFLWPEARFIVEADGGHHVGEQRDADNARDLVLQRAGYLIRRYGEGPLERPDEIAAEILTILRDRLPG